MDTNVLVSASRSREGKPYLAFAKAVSYPNQGVVCDQNIEEFRRVYHRKFPDDIGLLSDFLAFALPALEVVPTPSMDPGEEPEIRDITDRPVLLAALRAGVDIIVTGDRDFLESGIESPMIATPAMFVSGHLHGK